jgi:hypothetical protein
MRGNATQPLVWSVLHTCPFASQVRRQACKQPSVRYCHPSTPAPTLPNVVEATNHLCAETLLPRVVRCRSSSELYLQCSSRLAGHALLCFRSRGRCRLLRDEACTGRRGGGGDDRQTWQAVWRVDVISCIQKRTFSAMIEWRICQSCLSCASLCAADASAALRKQQSHRQLVTIPVIHSSSR